MVDNNVERRKARDAEWQQNNRDRVNASINQSHQKLRNDFFVMYGGKCACSGCSENNQWFLTLDHINNDGHQSRAQGKQNLHIYRDAVNEYRPDLFQPMCFNCNCGKNRNGKICPHVGVGNSSSFRKYGSKLTTKQIQEIQGRYRQWDRENGIEALAKDYNVCSETIGNFVLSGRRKIMQKRSDAAWTRKQRIHDKFFEMYGNKCACPGCNEKNKGFLTLDHVISNNSMPVDKRKKGLKAYRDAIREYRPDLYQVLCYNCNCAKNRNDEVCPHIEIKEKETIELNQKNKLTTEHVIEIRKTHKQYSRTYGTRNLARRFGVCNQTIEDVVYNRSWKNV